MSSVPPDPREFVEDFLPTRVREFEPLGGMPTSVGCLVFRVLGVGEWSLRLSEGRLEVGRGVEDDVLMQVTVTEDDFSALVVEGLREFAARPSAVKSGGLGVLALDPRTARGLRHMPGSVLFTIEDAGHARNVLLTPGLLRADMNAPDCTVRCSLEDYRAMQSGKENPMQLFANGRLKLSGNVQLALALAGVLA